MAEGSRLVPSGARSQVRGRPSGSYNEISGRVSGTSLNGPDLEADYERTAPLFTGDFIKSVVFGGLDGMITALAIIAAAAGGNCTWHIVLVIGIASIAANALSMGAGEYLSSKAHKEFVQAEKRRGMWEFKNFKNDEITEMVKRFVARGMKEADAKVVVTKMAQYENFFVNLMVSEELGLQLPEDNDASLLTDAFVMAISFALIGSLPLLVYGMGIFGIFSDHELFLIASGLMAVLIFLLGAMKSCFSEVFWVFSGFEAVIISLICAVVAYSTGSLVKNLVA